MVEQHLFQESLMDWKRCKLRTQTLEQRCLLLLLLLLLLFRSGWPSFGATIGLIHFRTPRLKSMPCVHSSMFFPNRPLNRSITFFLSSLELIHHKKIRKYQSLCSSFVSKLLLTMDNVNHNFRFCWLP